MADRFLHLIVVAAIVASASQGRAAMLADARLTTSPTANLSRAQLETEATGVFHGVGVVTEIDAASGALTLDHEEIKGLMPAMVMMYRVKSPELGQGLRIGDRIGFDLDAKSYTILSVTPLGHTK